MSTEHGRSSAAVASPKHLWDGSVGSITVGHSASPRKAAAPPTTVSHNHDSEVLPPHLKSVCALMEKNLQSLRKFANGFLYLTSSELQPALVRLRALIDSQSACMSDIFRIADQELRYCKEQINNLHHQMQDGDHSVSRQIMTMRFLYSTLLCATNITNAEEGLIFLFTTRANYNKIAASSSPHAESATPKAQEKTRKLLLVSHVRAKPFDAVEAGATSSDVLAICEAVAASSCAANFTVEANGPPRSFRSCLVCPVVMPGHATTVLGVVALLNKVAQYEGQFSKDDESRALFAAEQMGELLLQLPLDVSVGTTVPLSPSTFQQEWASLCGSSASDCGVDATLRERIPKKFVLRMHHDGRSLANIAFRSRNAIEPSEILDDVLDKYGVLQKELGNVDAQRKVEMARVDETELLLRQARMELRNALNETVTLRKANEQLLRSSFLPSTSQLSSSQVSPSVVPNSALCNGSAPPDTACVTQLPPRFIRSAEKLRNRSYFPLPPPKSSVEGWNPRCVTRIL